MASNDTSNAEAEERMSAYLDHELDPEESREFEEQLASSPDARKDLDDLRKLLRMVGSLPEVEAPADFYEKIARKIRRRKFLQGEFWLLVALPFQVLGVLLVLAIAVIYTMLHLDRDPAARLEKDPAAASAPADPANSAPDAPAAPGTAEPGDQAPEPSSP
ncbi:MAG TPA: zf-HC2 domain-containing protein [Nannocystaceae bacterium]|nr:zf-HC2 domain-containing protein [Nannocystaceae bacterium]